MSDADSPALEDAEPRFLVTFRRGAEHAALRRIGDVTGVRRVLRSADCSCHAVSSFTADDAVVLSRLGIAVLTAPPADAIERLGDEARRGDSPIRAVELAGVRARQSGGVVLPLFTNTPALSWGLQAMNVQFSSATGAGIRIGVLDTGLDSTHPDFANRVFASQSFFDNAPSTQDTEGHGTHCTGAAAGPRVPSQAPRYGVASDAELCIGRVLGQRAQGTDVRILAGIEWAIEMHCHVILVAAGSATPPSHAYEKAAEDAVNAGSLIIAAAGDNGDARGEPGEVMCPANVRRVMAVGAVDRTLHRPSFSARSGSGPAAQVNVVAPGREVLTSARVSVGTTHEIVQGTSVAAGFVAGIAALHAETLRDAGRSFTGMDLFQAVTTATAAAATAGPNVGNGIVQAP